MNDKIIDEFRVAALDALRAIPRLAAAAEKVMAFYEVETERARSLLEHERTTLGMVRENTRLTLELTRDALESRQQAKLSESDAKRVRDAITSGKLSAKQALAAIAQGIPVASLLEEVLPAAPANGS